MDGPHLETIHGEQSHKKRGRRKDTNIYFQVILAGDHKQLPPTIMSVDAASQGLELTLMERVAKADESKGDLVRMLTTQYRMNTKIMEWSSKTFYNSKLVADASVQSRLLSQLPGMAENEDTGILS